LSHKKIVVLIILIFTILLLVVGCGKGQVESSSNTSNIKKVSDNTEDYKEASDYTYNYEGYYDYTYSFSKYGFSFKYPEAWIVDELPSYLPTAKKEGSPDWGVNVYIEGDKENKISILGSYSSYSPTNFSKIKEFIIDDKGIGYLYIGEYDGKVNILVLYNKSIQKGYQNAVVFVNKDFYQQHKNEIWHILGSVKY